MSAYKVIVNLLKLLVLPVVFIFIYQKVPSLFDGSLKFPPLNSSFLIVLFLMPVNWSFEAYKWNLLIRDLAPQNFILSIKGVFSGITSSLFTPNRNGEFIGRILFLEKSSKSSGVLLSFQSSICQQLITCLFAFTASALAYNNSGHLFFLICLLISAIGSIILVIILFKRNKLSVLGITWIKKYLSKYSESTSVTSNQTINLVVLFSLIRYIIFSGQLFILLDLFGANLSILNFLIASSISFFVGSYIPSFAWAEAGIKGASSVYVFDFFQTDHSAVLSASISLWVINVATASLIGALILTTYKTPAND